MTREECVHILRNPYGHSAEEIRLAQRFACDEIEMEGAKATTQLTSKQVEDFRREHHMERHINGEPLEPWAVEQNHVLHTLCDSYHKRQQRQLAIAIRTIHNAIAQGEKFEAELDECRRVLSLFVDRFDDCSPWLPGEYRVMALACLRGSQYDPSLPS